MREVPSEVLSEVPPVVVSAISPRVVPKVPTVILVEVLPGNLPKAILKIIMAGSLKILPNVSSGIDLTKNSSGNSKF